MFALRILADDTYQQWLLRHGISYPRLTFPAPLRPRAGSVYRRERFRLVTQC